jgi:hypothetical protein
MPETAALVMGALTKPKPIPTHPTSDAGAQLRLLPPARDA